MYYKKALWKTSVVNGGIYLVIQKQLELDSIAHLMCISIPISSSTWEVLCYLKVLAGIREDLWDLCSTAGVGFHCWQLDV